MNFKNVSTKLTTLALAGAALLMGGCASTAYNPGMVNATPNKDGVLFVDLRNKSLELNQGDVRVPVERLLSENCKLAENSKHPVCMKPSDYVVFSGQVRNAMWGKGPVFVGVFVPRALNATSMPKGSERDGDIVRARIIPGPVSMFVYDGIIERHNDPARKCKWEGTHNYSGGVVCPEYGYSYKDLDVSKL